VTEEVTLQTKEIFTGIEDEISIANEDTLRTYRKISDTAMMTNNLQEEMVKVRRQQMDL
jgi:hypothetical protein